MRKRSIKVRITVWYTALMVLMAAMVLAFVVAISSSVTVQTDLTYLSQTVRGNLNQVSLQDGALELGADFSFVQGGVYTVVYSESGGSAGGVSFPSPFLTVSEPFQNGYTRPVETGQGEYYILDLWVPSGWETGIWVRGFMEVSEGGRAVHSLLVGRGNCHAGLILVWQPGRLLDCPAGLPPLDVINATASTINEGRDLSARHWTAARIWGVFPASRQL